MGSSKGVRFLNSITTKVNALLVIAFTLIIALVFYIVNNEGFDNIRAESDKLMIQSGENTVKLMSFNLASAMRSASQLRDASEIAPLESTAFDHALNQVFNEDNYPLLGSGGIWPNAYIHHSEEAVASATSDQVKPNQVRPEQVRSSQNTLKQDALSMPMIRIRQATGYSKDESHKVDSNYVDTLWFNTVKHTDPATCIWNHITLTVADKGFSMRCALPIHRDNDFWGVASVNFTLDAIQAAIDPLDTQLGNGYAVLIDNSNHIIASSAPKRVPYIDRATGEMMLLSEFAQQHPEWAPIEDAITQHRKQKISQMVKRLPRATVNQLNAYDDAQGTIRGSMLINAAASISRGNTKVSVPSHSYLSSHNLIDEHNPNSNATAYLFEVPETLWKLVIIRPTDDVNALADNLSDHLTKYLVLALILTAITLLILLEVSVFSPIRKTAHDATTAAQLLSADVESKQYEKLSTLTFDASRQDEIGQVNESLNQLLSRIEDSEDALYDANQRLLLGDKGYIDSLRAKLEPKKPFDTTHLKSDEHTATPDTQPTDAQAIDSQSINSQSINSQSVNSQSVSSLLVDSQSINRQSIKSQSTGNMSINNPSTNTESSDEIKQPNDNSARPVRVWSMDARLTEARLTEATNNQDKQTETSEIKPSKAKSSEIKPSESKPSGRFENISKKIRERFLKKKH